MNIDLFEKDEDPDYCPLTDDRSSDGCTDDMEIDPEEEDNIMISRGGLTCTNSSSQKTYLSSLQNHKNICLPKLRVLRGKVAIVTTTLVLNTNEEITSKRNKYSEQNSATIKETNASEINALLGLLVLIAALKDNHVNSLELFDSTYIIVEHAMFQ